MSDFELEDYYAVTDSCCRAAGYAKEFDVNFFATINVTVAFLPHMRERKSGTIVLMGSRHAWKSQFPVSTALILRIIHELTQYTAYWCVFPRRGARWVLIVTSSGVYAASKAALHGTYSSELPSIFVGSSYLVSMGRVPVERAETVRCTGLDNPAWCPSHRHHWHVAIQASQSLQNPRLR